MEPNRVFTAKEMQARKKCRAQEERLRYEAKHGFERERMLAHKREVEQGGGSETAAEQESVV